MSKEIIKETMAGKNSAAGLEVYSGFSENQLRHFFEPEPGLFIAETPNVIERALDDGYEAISFFTESGFQEEKILPLIERAKKSAADENMVKVFTADHESMKKMTGYNITMGVLCAMRRRKLPELSDLCRDKKRVAVMVDVENPTNVGAIFRSAAALGMEAVVLTSDCADPLYRRALRVGMGTAFQIPWTVTGKSGTELIKELKENGFKCAAMALKDDTLSIEDERLKKTEQLAIVLGSEGYGLPDGTISACDYTIKIPMSNGVDSLNVAAAAALAFWQLRK